MLHSSQGLQVCSSCLHNACISNNSSFRQKHPGVPDSSDGSDATSYPLTENYTLPVARATGRVAYVPPLLCGDVYPPSEGHVCYTLPRGCIYAEAVYTTPGDVKSSLLLIVKRFSKLMHSVCILIYVSMYLCIYVSIELPIYTRYIWTGSTR